MTRFIEVDEFGAVLCGDEGPHDGNWTVVHGHNPGWYYCLDGGESARADGWTGPYATVERAQTGAEIEEGANAQELRKLEQQAAPLRIPRTGKPALQIEGELLAAQRGKLHLGQALQRWYDLAIYRTRAGKIVVAAEYGSTWQGEDTQAAAEVVETLHAVPSALQTVKAQLDSRTSHYGYPVAYGAQFQAKQERMLALLLSVWESRVTLLMDELDLTEAVP